MTSDEIRETFLEYFAARDHLRLPSASLVPTTFDPSTLFIVAGMQPLKSYFLGLEKPPHHRLTACQKVVRTIDLENVGNTTRHLTFFEMLGNFSLGDYFRQGAVEHAWELSLEGYGLDPQRIWITVFEGDDELGLGPDEEAIAAWEAVGVPRERIVLCPRSENFWQAGPTGPCGPCSELYYDRGLQWGAETDLPGGENERFLEYWNLVFMQFNQEPAGTLTPLLWSRAGGRRARRSRPAHPGRSFPGDDVPHRRRRRALQRGARLRPAEDHAPGDPAGPFGRDEAGVPRGVQRMRRRAHGGGLSRAAPRTGCHPALGAGRGDRLRPHARAGDEDPGGGHRARA